MAFEYECVCVCVCVLKNMPRVRSVMRKCVDSLRLGGQCFEAMRFRTVCYARHSGEMTSMAQRDEVARPLCVCVCACVCVVIQALVSVSISRSCACSQLWRKIDNL